MILAVRVHSLCLITICTVFAFNIQFISGATNSKRLNRLTFEKLKCFSNPGTGAVLTKCSAKLISRDHIRAKVEATYNHTINDIFVHYRSFYQFSSNVYRPLLINGWESVCGYFNGDPGNLVISGTYRNFANYTNIDHKCPYAAGTVFLNISDLYINSMPMTLVPSGRYRLEISAHETFEGPMMAEFHIFGSVSDHRIVKV